VTLEDRYEEIKNDPKKRARAFKVIWLAGYGMLMLGAILIVVVIYLNLS
jgi:predicted nucleic acid-binding Zn ribbon protein